MLLEKKRPTASSFQCSQAACITKINSSHHTASKYPCTHELRPAWSGYAFPQTAAPTNPNNQQNCVQYARYIIFGTRHCWPKFSKYIATGCSAPITSFLGLGPADSSINNSSRLKIHQNAVFYIPTRTSIHLIKSQAKNHATSHFSHKLSTFSSSLFAISKKTLSGSLPCIFSLRAQSKTIPCSEV